MPVGDWQFWVVTLAAVVGAWMIYRSVRPRKRKTTRTQLTVEGRGRKR